MLRMTYTCLILAFCFTTGLLAQTPNGVRIGNEAGDPVPSAVLDLDVNDRGFLLPRMSTSERNAIVDPADGLMIFNIGTGFLNFYDAIVGEWYAVAPIVDRPVVDTLQEMTLGSAAFVPSSNAENFVASLTNGAYFTSGTGSVRANIPVPAGARITEVTIYYKDDVDDDGLNFYLTSEDLESNQFQDIFEGSSSSVFASPDIQSTTIAIGEDSQETQAGRSYIIDVFGTSTSSLSVRGAKIRYVLPTSN